MTHEGNRLDAFLVSRADRVNASLITPEAGKIYSYFPSYYWPGWAGWRNSSEVSMATPWSTSFPDWIWCHILSTPYCKGGSIPIRTRKELPAFPNCNGDWDGILASLSRVGRPSGEGEFRRPEGPFVFDLVKDPAGGDILEAAHVVAHARAMVSGERRKSNLFLETLAELVLSLRWGVTFHCPSESQILCGEKVGEYGDFFSERGVKVVTSTRIRKPWLSMNAVGPNGPLPGHDCIAVLCGVHLEPEPWSAREGNPNAEDRTCLEMNRWSCMPSLVSLDGWKCLDELYKAPLVLPWANAGKEDVCLTLPVTALDPPSILDLLAGQMAKASGCSQDPVRGIWNLGEFLKSDWYRKLRRVTPPLPCRECLKLNMASPGAPTRPSCKRPDPSRNSGNGKREKREKWLEGALAEWAAYDEKVDRIFEVVDRACAFHDRRFGNVPLRERRRRLSNAGKASELLGKIDRARERAGKLRRDSEYTRALAEDKKAADARLALAKLMEEQ